MTAGISTPLPASLGSARAGSLLLPGARQGAVHQDAGVGTVLGTDLPRGRRERCPDGRPTLDEVVSSAWAALAWGAPAACPVCDGAMTPQPESSAARCRDCGTALS